MAAESFWKYAVDPRQQPAAAGTAAPAPAPVWQRSGSHHASGPVAPPPVPAGAAPLKRQRPDYFDRPSRQERAGFHEAMGSSYGRHLNNEMTYVGASQITRPRGGMAASPNDNYHMMGMVGLDSRNMGSPRTYPALRPDASNTLYVEGLPGNCTRREVSYIFRPFSGFREVRLVNKESRHPNIYYIDEFSACRLDGIMSYVSLILPLLPKLLLLWRLCKAINLMKLIVALPICTYNSLSWP